MIADHPWCISLFSQIIHPLEAAVQYYDWGKVGSSSLVAQLQDTQVNEAKPYAELWLGTHPNGPSFILENGNLWSSVWSFFIDICQMTRLVWRSISLHTLSLSPIFSRLNQWMLHYLFNLTRTDSMPRSFIKSNPMCTKIQIESLRCWLLLLVSFSHQNTMI